MVRGAPVSVNSTHLISASLKKEILQLTTAAVVPMLEMLWEEKIQAWDLLQEPKPVKKCLFV